MNKTPAFYLFFGLLIGGILGVGIGAINGNTIHGIQLGSMAGLFIGWIMTASAFQN